jgi:PII-like signaling protein
MKRHGTATRLTIYVGESHQWHHRPLYTEIVHRAHAAKLAGAAVFRGIEGYGSSLMIHTTRILSLGEDLPVAVVIVDEEERIRAFLDEVEEVLSRGLVVLDEVEVYRYTEDQVGVRPA